MSLSRRPPVPGRWQKAVQHRYWGYMLFVGALALSRGLCGLGTSTSEGSPLSSLPQAAPPSPPSPNRFGRDGVCCRDLDCAVRKR